MHIRLPPFRLLGLARDEPRRGVTSLLAPKPAGKALEARLIAPGRLELGRRHTCMATGHERPSELAAARLLRRPSRANSNNRASCATGAPGYLTVAALPTLVLVERRVLVARTRVTGTVSEQISLTRRSLRL